MANTLSLIKATDGPVSDHALCALLQEHHEQAMVCLFNRYSRLVYSTALRVLRDTAAAEDVMQELFFQIWRKPPTVLTGSESLAGWFTIVSRNRAIDVLRKRTPAYPIDDVPIASPYDLSKEAEKNLMLEQVQLVMEELPIEQRRALELAFFEGLTHEEISAKTGHPLGTIKSRIRCALRTLGKAFPTRTGVASRYPSLSPRPFTLLSFPVA